MSQSLLNLDALVVARGHAVLARGITRTLAAGDMLLLTGPNGSGKTTFLRVAAGLLPASGGTLQRACACHWLPALPLEPSLETPRQYLSFQAALMGARLDPAGDPFGIAPVLDTPLNRLSTGWRQRVKLTRLTLAARPLWLLDEPGDGLDSAGEAAFRALVETHLKNGGAAMIATHDPHLWPGAATLEFGGAA